MDTSDFQNCEWTLNVTSCIGQDFFQVVYGVTIYLSLFVFLCAVWLLSWRLYSRPDSRLFSIKGFLALEGFLFTQIFWGGARIVSCLILLYNISPTSMLLREMSFDVTWLLGTVSVATYLAAILRTIPRMRFYRQNSYHKRLLRLPDLRGMAIVYTTFVIALGTIVIVCSFFIGYLRDRTVLDPYSSIHSKTISTLMAIQYSTQSISCFLIAIAFLIYGKKLIKIASEGLSLFEGFSGYPTTPTSNRFSSSTIGVSSLDSNFEQKRRQLERSIVKMRVLNSAFIASFAILGIFIGLFAFFHQSIFENLTLSEAFAALDNWIPMVLNVFVMAGIAYGEIRIPDKSESTLANLIYPTTPTIPAIPRRRSSDGGLSSITTASSSAQTTDGRGSFHIRDTSTDSDTPLLRWPIPKAVVPTHIHANELNYLSQNVVDNPSSTSLNDESATVTTTITNDVTIFL